MTAPAISFCMTICSRRRPALLENALNSVVALHIPEGVALSILLVENDTSPTYTDIAARAGEKYPLHYVVEPRAGLCYGRNRVLEEAEKTGADWIGSIDDDVTISADWLVHMVAAIRKYPDTGVFYGHWQRLKNPEEPAWHPEPKPLNPYPTGRQIQVSSFNSITVSADVFTAAGMGLRFDPAFNFSGGEDTDFTRSYLAKSGIIRSVQEARATEIIAESRASLAERLARETQSAFILAKINRKYSRRLPALFWNFQNLYRSAMLGSAYMVLGMLAIPFNRIWGLNRYTIGKQFFARGRGILQFYFGTPPEPYRDTPAK